MTEKLIFVRSLLGLPTLRAGPRFRNFYVFRINSWGNGGGHQAQDEILKSPILLPLVGGFRPFKKPSILS